MHDLKDWGLYIHSNISRYLFQCHLLRDGWYGWCHQLTRKELINRGPDWLSSFYYSGLLKSRVILQKGGKGKNMWGIPFVDDWGPNYTFHKILIKQTIVHEVILMIWSQPATINHIWIIFTLQRTYEVLRTNGKTETNRPKARLNSISQRKPFSCKKRPKPLSWLIMQIA